MNQLFEAALTDRLVASWSDPYPPPVLEAHRGFWIVRDDLLSAGSKVRFLDALLQTEPHIREWVFGSCPAQGWAQVSLPVACARYGKKAVLFMANRLPENYTGPQKLGMANGAIYHWVDYGMLTVTEARAREYANASPATRKVLPIGLEHPIILEAIAKVALSVKAKAGPPKEIWCVGSSGVLSRGLQRAFPDARHNIVSVGHTMSQREIGKAKMYRHPMPFEKPVNELDAPPYPSVANYDAKVWAYVVRYGTPGAWVWNVAADKREGK